jgi:hypothetical protein
LDWIRILSKRKRMETAISLWINTILNLIWLKKFQEIMKSMTLRCRLPISKNKLMEILAKHLIEPESTLNKLRGQTQANQGKTRDKSSIYKTIWLTNKFSKRTFYNRISRLTIFKISETSTTGTIMTINKINQEVFLANKFCIRMKRQDSLVRSRMWCIMQAKIIN